MAWMARKGGDAPDATGNSNATGAASSSSASSSSAKVNAMVNHIKRLLSMILIVFSVVVVSAAILTKQTTATTGESGVHPMIALCTFWFSLLWLALMEGGLNCMVGLQPVDKLAYRSSHLRTYLCTRVAHKGDNIERFIVGRQYLDLMIVFLTSFMVSATDNASVLGLPPMVNRIFLGQDLAVILCTIVFGQLIAQINSAASMLDFMNNWVMVGTTYVALCVESSGILHAVYLIQIFFTKLAGKTVETKEPPKTKTKKALFWLRVLFSLAISIFAIVVFMTALLGGNTPVREEIPKAVSIVSLLVLVLLGGFMEALQIALFAVKHLPAADPVESNDNNSRATQNLQLIFEQNKLEAFLVGRQIAQTVIMFLIARIITIDMKSNGNDETNNLFGVPDPVQAFFNSGLLNALVSTIFASLSWRVTANAFPMVFLSNQISIWIIRLCLVVEGTGICDAAWSFARIHQFLVRYRPDTTFFLATAGIETLAAESNTDLELGKKTSGAEGSNSGTTTKTSESSDSMEEEGMENDSIDITGYEVVYSHEEVVVKSDR